MKGGHQMRLKGTVRKQYENGENGDMRQKNATTMRNGII